MTASLIALATQRFFATVLQSAWNKLRNGMETGTVNAFPGPVSLTVPSRAFSIQLPRGPASGHLTFWMERQGATVTANWHLNCFDKHPPLTECPIGVSPGRQLRPDGQTHWK